jgi:hypothetical protein
MISEADLLLHAFKHHLEIIRTWLDANKYQWNEEVRKQIMTLGGSQLDFYTGRLQVQEIKEEIIGKLSAEKIMGEAAYKSWVAAGNGYRTVQLSDASEWTLRHVPEVAFVHIHPSRYAAHTVRVKANALKTSVCLLLLKGDTDLSNAAMNECRSYLGLPPLKLNERHAEMEAVLHMLRFDKKQLTGDKL